MNNRFHFIPLVVAAVTLFTSCEKEETPMVLPSAGMMDTLSASMGINYDNQVYVDFKTGTSTSVPYRSYDLAFEASANGFRIYLNTGKFMFAGNTGLTDMSTADSTNLLWRTETEHLYDDSSSFGQYMDLNGNSKLETYVIDRGRTEHFGSDRWRKFQILAVNNNEYRIRFSNYDNNSLTDFVVPKDPEYALMYFSFDGGGQMVNVAPKKTDWDVVFTKYTYTFYSEPITSPYRHYLVAGTLLNKWSGCRNEQMRLDSTLNYVPFETFTSSNIPSVNFNDLAGKIGFSWKDYDFSLGYVIIPNRFYLVRDSEGYVYKIRFYDFYDNFGNKGTPKFEYQRL